MIPPAASTGYYWLLFLLLLAGLGILFSAFWRSARKGHFGSWLKKKSENTPKPTTSNKAAIFLAGCALGGAIFYPIGFFYRDHQLVVNTREYTGVSVLQQYSERSYTVHVPGYDKDYGWDFCHPLEMPGPLIDIKYEQRYGCKQVNGIGFVQIHKEKRNAELQDGRNSTASEAAYLARTKTP